MSVLRHPGVRRFLRASVLSAITIFVADFALGPRRDLVCKEIDSVPGVSCPSALERPDSAAGLVFFVTLAVVIALTVLQRQARTAWIDRVVATGDTVALSPTWTAITFLQWLSLLAGLTLMQGLSSTRFDPASRDEIGGGTYLVTAALVVVSAGLWVSWRSYRTYAWATRRRGAPFLPGVEAAADEQYRRSLHKVTSREARDSDYHKPHLRDVGDPLEYIVECATCGYSNRFESQYKAALDADDHRQATAPH